jgi:hypothetical protein
VGWTTAAEVRAAIKKKWDSGALLTRYASGLEWEPVSVPLRGPAAREIGERLADVQRWAASWKDAGPLRVEYKQVGGRHFGTNSIPVRAWLDGYDDTWSLLRTGAEVKRLSGLLDRTPGAIRPWVTAHPMRALRHAGEWDKLLAVVQWIDQRQRPGMYLRQVDVPGVDTKFIEGHRGVLGELLDAQLDSARITPASADFAVRYGFLRKPGYIRFRGEFRGLTEATVRVDELPAPPDGVTRVFVVENEITYLAFPLPTDAMVVWGHGYSVDVLAPLSWLDDLDVVYWGDIDTHGFAILSRLRSAFPRVRSMLMDRVTLLGHREQWVTEPSPVAASLSGLSEVEAELYGELVAGVYGPGVRLEQERISYSAIERAVTVMSARP